jgi:hypothetical protein
MSATADQLQSLKHGKSKKIRGIDVTKDGEYYSIDEVSYSLDEAVQKIEQSNPKSGIDYGWTAFVEARPSYPCREIKTHRCRNKSEHTELLAAVKKRGHYLYYGTVVKDNGRYYAKPPFLIDWESVPDIVEPPKPKPIKASTPAEWDGGLSCPFCNKSVLSTPGRTLHVKHYHPDKVDEYQELLARSVQPRTVVEEVNDDDEDDVVDRVKESETVKSFKCPFCDSEPSSSSGRTLHVQGKHPEKLAEYQKMIVGGQL